MGLVRGRAFFSKKNVRALTNTDEREYKYTAEMVIPMVHDYPSSQHLLVCTLHLKCLRGQCCQGPSSPLLVQQSAIEKGCFCKASRDGAVVSLIGSLTFGAC